MYSRGTNGATVDEQIAMQPQSVSLQCISRVLCLATLGFSVSSMPTICSAMRVLSTLAVILVRACRTSALAVAAPAADALRAPSNSMQPHAAAASSPWSIPAQTLDPVTPTGLHSRMRLLGAATSFNGPPEAAQPSALNAVQPQGYADDPASAARPFSAAPVSMGGNARVSGAGARQGPTDSMQSPRTFLRPGSNAPTAPRNSEQQAPAALASSSRAGGQQRAPAAQTGSRHLRADSGVDSDDDSRSGRRNARGPAHVSLLDRSLAPVCQAVSNDVQVCEHCLFGLTINLRSLLPAHLAERGVILDVLVHVTACLHACRLQFSSLSSTWRFFLIVGAS